MNPLVTILIPVFQVEPYLKRCLDSVVGQTYQNIEVIMIDDNSNDNSSEIANAYVQNYGFTLKINRNRLGVAGVRQQLLNRAHGEYVFFLDSDDFLDPRTIEFLVEIAEANKADVVQCGYHKTVSDERFEIDYSQFNMQTYSNHEAVELLQSGYGTLRSMVWGKLCRKNTLENICFPYGKIHEDEAVIHEILYQARKVVNINIPLYYYFKHSNSIMNREFTYDRLDILDALSRRIVFLEKHQMRFAAVMCGVRYCLQCVDLYRKITEVYGEANDHLYEVHLKYIRMKEYVLSDGNIDIELELKQLLEMWGVDPLIGEVPDYWVLSKAYFEKKSNVI